MITQIVQKQFSYVADASEILHLMCHQMPFWCGIRCKTFLEDYPLTRNYYKNNSPRITFRNF